MLWFNFILGLNFNFLLFLGMAMYDHDMMTSLKLKQIKFKPRIKLNHNMHIMFKIVDVIKIILASQQYCESNS